MKPKSHEAGMFSISLGMINAVSKHLVKVMIDFSSDRVPHCPHYMFWLSGNEAEIQRRAGVICTVWIAFLGLVRRFRELR